MRKTTKRRKYTPRGTAKRAQGAKLTTYLPPDVGAEIKARARADGCSVAYVLQRVILAGLHETQVQA